jgi:hypothetical protein
MSEIHNANLSGQDTVENYIREFPNQEQVKMMTTWLADNQPGVFTFTGLVDPREDTVITPQATVDYGYCWFSLSDGPAVVDTPEYDRFFSVSVFDMRHNVPAVVVHPGKPILLIRPGQVIPDGDFEVVELETDQGLVFTRMVVVDNIDEVRELSRSIVMDGGDGDMHRDVQRFSPLVERAALQVLEGVIVIEPPGEGFGKRSGDVGEILSAAFVLIGQLGTPSESVKYSLILSDQDGEALNGIDTYVVTVPGGIVHDDGYFSVTVYGADNKLLIPNEEGIYDRTSYTSERNDDGTYTITLRPNGEGTNGIPTGKPFYALLRAYMPVDGIDMTPSVIKV